MNFIRTIWVHIILLWSLTKIRTQKKKIVECRKSGNFEEEMKHILDAERIYTKYVIKRLKLNVEIEGIENLPENGPVLFMANHQSYFDILIAIYALDKFPFGFIAKDSTSKIPVFNRWLENVRCLFIKRENTKEALRLIKEAGELFDKGYSMFIFPEGTRGDSEEMQEFKAGSFKFATRAKVPIVPITLIGTRNLYETNGYFKRSDTKIIIHKMIETKELGKAEEKQLVKDVEKLIRDTAY